MAPGKNTISQLFETDRFGTNQGALAYVMKSNLMGELSLAIRTSVG